MSDDITNQSEELVNRTPPLPPVPEGMSKKQWKKMCKRQRWEENKSKYNAERRVKKKRLRHERSAKIQEYIDRGEDVPQELVREPRVNVNQIDSGIEIILDCSFDELMNDKEIVSLSNQVTRAYSANRRASHFAEIKVAPFDKRLKERFETTLKNTNYEKWNHFKFLLDDKIMYGDEHIGKDNIVYLTADTDEKLEKLEPGMRYIVGGIVDKNRYKDLCLNKAQKMGIPTRRLPIDEYINLEGRRVLTTTHVVQLMLKYFDVHDWKNAFETVLPPRKLDAETVSPAAAPATEDV
ncbi:Trm10p [Saccharomyces cerevisiae x Saccharomyces kudriavzevii VIN7]|uniref:tRNA (guanine(9)-N1)-methyltransferase n=1 Tax=Saccharomyces cerevisiae x Saccharomyces kudriavzevii (strain VIN7) TaxID=1095631 RepID=H0H0R7_SACCK|nr:Trm10p [Saccharomyces cerevisiae x Saccharomyces kudriavzevii VIN7]